VSARSEFALIERIRKAVPSLSGARARGEVRLGIGDDAAVIQPRAGRELVISTDQLIEGAHFLLPRHPADAVGYKALARATSDLAAMGADPRYFFMTMALPASRTGRWLDEFLGGMARAAHEFQMFLLGGDLARQRTVTVSLTVIGEISPGRFVARSGARPGDAIFVSGTLGRAALGLQMFLRRGNRAGRNKSTTTADAIRAHLYPQPRLALGQWLARKRLATSMIDISDGFSTDLHHLCEASGIGARVRVDALPAVQMSKAARSSKLELLELALHGGDDYELLFTVPSRFAPRIRARFGNLPLSYVGEMTRNREILLVQSDGKSRPLPPRGWDHF
jgi:thiamine-monophosphate kinase